MIRGGRDYRWVGIYKVSRGELIIAGATGNTPPAYPRFPVTQGLCGAAVEGRETIVVADVHKDPRYLPTFGTTQSEILVPIVNDNSAVAAKRQVEKIRELDRYAQVLSVYMEEPPLVSDWVTLTDTPNVVVVPFFISDGLHSYEDIPVLLGIDSPSAEGAGDARVFRENPRLLHGRALYYARSIGTDERFADVIVDQARTFEAELADAHSMA